MDELEFYDGAWTGQEIDAGIGLTGTLADALAVVVDGNKSTISATIRQYVLVKNSTILGVSDGIYRSAKAIPARTAIDATYLASVSNGALNDLTKKNTFNPTILQSGVSGVAPLYINRLGGFVTLDLTFNNNISTWTNIATYDSIPGDLLNGTYTNIKSAVFQLYNNAGVTTLRVQNLEAGTFRGNIPVMVQS